MQRPSKDLRGAPHLSFSAPAAPPPGAVLSCGRPAPPDAAWRLPSRRCPATPSRWQPRVVLPLGLRTLAPCAAPASARPVFCQLCTPQNSLVGRFGLQRAREGSERRQARGAATAAFKQPSGNLLHEIHTVVCRLGPWQPHLLKGVECPSSSKPQRQKSWTSALPATTKSRHAGSSHRQMGRHVSQTPAALGSSSYWPIRVFAPERSLLKDRGGDQLPRAVALMLRIARLACFAAAIAAIWAALLQKTTEEPAKTAVLLVRASSSGSPLAAGGHSPCGGRAVPLWAGAVRSLVPHKHHEAGIRPVFR